MRSRRDNVGQHVRGSGILAAMVISEILRTLSGRPSNK